MIAIPKCSLCAGGDVHANTVDRQGFVTSWFCGDCLMWFDPLPVAARVHERDVP